MSLNPLALPPEYRARVLHYASVTSTMDIAAQLLRGDGAGVEPLTCVVADRQSAGRGRQGRSWTTFPDHSLACTFILPTPYPFSANPAGQGALASHLPLIAALTLHQTLTQLAPALPVVIKWPNDLLLQMPPTGIPARQRSITPFVPADPPASSHVIDGYGKISGMLIESTPAGILFGLGLNLTRSPAMSEAFQGLALDDRLAEAPTREALLSVLFPCLKANLALYPGQGWAAFHQEYVRHCVTIGQEVVWKNATKTELRGLALGLHDQTGALQLQAEDGTVHLIHSGDVVAQGRVNPSPGAAS